jgi:Inositol hexakisphosphate
MLQLIGCGPVGVAPVDPVRPPEGRRVAVWHNLREEPLLYINGTPYVLRERTGAYSNMREYSSINGDRLEDLEKRLKEEVLDEAQRLGGKVQVLYEEMTAVVRRPHPPRLCLRACAQCLRACAQSLRACTHLWQRGAAGECSAPDACDAESVHAHSSMTPCGSGCRRVAA